ncbi:MAG: flagellar export chaperone FlgN [Bacillota bacterium]
MNLNQLYQKLYQLSQQQTEAIKEDDYDQLMEYIKEKQEIIDEIDKISLKEHIRKQDNPEQVFENIKELLTKINELEIKNQELIQKAKGELAEEMLDFNKKQKSRQGYYNKKGYDAKFIDKKS